MVTSPLLERISFNTSRIAKTEYTVGIDKLIAWLKSKDTKIAPASGKYHCAYAGGLVEHSLHVYERLKKLLAIEYPVENNQAPMYTDETIALVALLHDVSKIDFYEISYKNVKDANGDWTKVPFYQIKDTSHRFIYGSHAMNSVYIVRTFVKLTYQEELAILYHMGGFDYTEDSISVKNISEAFSKSPLALLLHQADMQATYLDEVESE